MQTTTPRIKSLINESAYSHQLIDIINNLPKTIKTISFDCFDTILWRTALEPKDVFYSLNKNVEKNNLSIDYSLRIKSESLAYKMMRIKKNKTQIGLSEIYQHAFPLATQNELDYLIENEMTAELNHCFAFQPMIEVMRLCKKNNLQIIVVSDTYFSKPMLQRLLKTKLPADVYQSIDHIYCSSEYGVAKHETLFSVILEKLRIQGRNILHIGDNPISDVQSPAKIGMHAIEFKQYQLCISEILRMQAIGACYFNSALRTDRGIVVPFKDLYATNVIDSLAPTTIGYATVGPVLFSFASYINETYINACKKHSSVKILYLLRDGYLASEAVKILLGNPLGDCVRISRFSAFASSFRTNDDIDNYLTGRIDSQRYNEICKQLLLPDDKSDIIIKATLASDTPNSTFVSLIQKQETVNIIIKESTAYRQRLYQYLKKSVQLQRGDTLIFVDLGYTGTTQIQLAPVFHDEMDITIIGCYLIALRTAYNGLIRFGLLSTTHYDDKSLVMLVTYIALFEQICTSMDKSVIDFDHDGNPIYADCPIDAEQGTKVKAIQAEALRFIHDAKKKTNEESFLLNGQDYRDLASSNLVRLLYLPTQIENEYFSSINHDVNMGTDDVTPIIDIELGLNNLKRRGWLNCLKEPSTLARMNYPSEWRAIALDLSLVLMSQYRHDFKISINDMSHRSISISAILQTPEQNDLIDLIASPTYDGYYSLICPIPTFGSVGILLGSTFKCIELYSLEKIQLQYLYTKTEQYHTQDASNDIILNDMTLTHECIVDIHNHDSILIYTAKNNAHLIEPDVLRIVFRPLVMQS